MDLFSLENLFTLLMLVFLQAVLGFDNLLYISIESKRVAEDQQQKVRRLGIGIAIFLRIALLFAVVNVIALFQDPFFSPHVGEWFKAEFNVHSVIVLAGGIFIMYTAFKEITHMLSIHEPGAHEEAPLRSTGVAIAWIVVMNLVFSFDSILSAIALTDSLPVMATAIVISGFGMMALADHVSEFLKRNRMYEVLGLFILLIVGVMLVGEGGHTAHIHFGEYAVEPMAKTTFYFSIAILTIVDIAQGRYQKKLDAERAEGAH
ncbi:MAG: TerC family protein [Myxococcota bacterium]